MDFAEMFTVSLLFGTSFENRKRVKGQHKLFSLFSKYTGPLNLIVTRSAIFPL